MEGKRTLPTVREGEKCVIIVENCPGHACTQELQKTLAETRTEVRFLPKNATEICQPTATFIIQKVKAAWRKRWDKQCVELVETEAWKTHIRGCGKLQNPGKRFYFQLAADAIRNSNAQRDSNGVLYTRKAMIRWGMAKSMNGIWEFQQLFASLQEIAGLYREKF